MIIGALNNICSKRVWYMQVIYRILPNLPFTIIILESKNNKKAFSLDFSVKVKSINLREKISQIN